MTYSNIQIAFLSRWVFLWFVIIGMFNLVIKPLGVNYYETFYVVVSYYLIGICLIKYLFEKYQFRKSLIELRSLFFVSVFGLFLSGLLALGDHYFPIALAKKNNLQNMGFYFPYWEFPSNLSKYTDIFFQQVMIFYLIASYKEKGFYKPKGVFLFSVLFLLMHTPLFFLLPKLAFYLVPGSFLAGLAFAAIHFYFKKSLLYSILVHCFFYVIVSIYFRYIV